MELRTYRANSMQEALALVRRELGPRASVLHTREVVGGGLLKRLSGTRMIEVVASASVNVPSRLPPRPVNTPNETATRSLPTPLAVEPRLTTTTSSQHDHFSAIRSAAPPRHELPESLFRLFTDLIEADVHEDLARELVESVCHESQSDDAHDSGRLKGLLASRIEADFAVTGPIRTTPGCRRLVALVGPTGVGKTTTIAKLAANFRLREKQRVGLITVDTYRIAAVEQLRTYADIIDLPMEIVATPREMLQALSRLSDLDLILMDTAGRSPRDEVKIQELKSMLTQAAPDEVHLVLSSVGSAAGLLKTAEQFASVGTTALVLTKLDEATSLGNLLPLLRGSRLPLSYLTHGQNVPDDIGPADAGRLARGILGMETIGGN